MNERRLAGYIIWQEDQRLLLRKSWWWYAIGVIVAIAVLIAMGCFVANFLHDPSMEIGGSRGHRGRLVLWSQQTLGQRMENAFFRNIVPVGFSLAAIAFICFGAEDQRNPWIFDREKEILLKGEKQICSLKSLTAVRLVGKPILRRTILPKTKERVSPVGVFLAFKGEPWAVEIDWLRRYYSAADLGHLLADFLSVGISEDSIALKKDNRPGFPVQMKNK